ncbi:hypothetical protein LCGC14_2018360 [marine sediment metagenome]|uniref:Uncharacterized protein n=1 Tax=marine sediment metagenome TaxID=412755 RepID=A0A0F9EYG9_9ZZZZ
MSKVVGRSLMSPVLKLSPDGAWLRKEGNAGLVCTEPLWDMFEQPLDATRYYLELSEKCLVRGCSVRVGLKAEATVNTPSQNWWYWRWPGEEWDLFLSAADTLLSKCPHADKWRRGVKLWLTLWYVE